MTLAWMGTQPEEFECLRGALEAAVRQHHAGREFHAGRLDGRELVLVRCGPDAVASAITATLLIERYGATAIVATGLAAALAPGLRLGDVLLARELRQPAREDEALFVRTPAPAGRASWPTDALLGDGLAAAARAALEAERIGLAASLAAFDIGAPRLHEGLLLSDARGPGHATEARALHAAWPAALAVETGAAAIARVCDDADLPFVLLHTVARRPDGSGPAVPGRFAAEVAAPLAAAILRRWLRDGAAVEPDTPA